MALFRTTASMPVVSATIFRDQELESRSQRSSTASTVSLRRKSVRAAAGHFRRILTEGETGEDDDDSIAYILKPYDEVETSIYVEVWREENAALHPFVAKFGGLTRREDAQYMRLTNLTQNLDRPNIMDCKIGVRSFQESEVLNKKLRPDMYERCLSLCSDQLTEEEHEQKAMTKYRFMQFRDHMSSTVELGFRIDGIVRARRSSSENRRSKYQHVRCRKDILKEILTFLPWPSDWVLIDRGISRPSVLSGGLTATTVGTAPDFHSWGGCEDRVDSNRVDIGSISSPIVSPSTSSISWSQVQPEEMIKRSVKAIDGSVSSPRSETKSVTKSCGSTGVNLSDSHIANEVRHFCSVPKRSPCGTPSLPVEVGEPVMNELPPIPATPKHLRRVRRTDSCDSDIIAMEGVLENSQADYTAEDKLRFAKENLFLCELIEKKLREFQDAICDSDFFVSHEFVGTSLLFLCDNNRKAEIFMIDFAKTKVVENQKLNHNLPWAFGNHEDGYLTGVENLISCWSELRTIFRDEISHFEEILS